MDDDFAGVQFDDLAVAREVVGALAGDLDGGIARRHLRDDPGEPGKCGLDGLHGRAQVARGDRAALGVVGIGLDAPLHGEGVGLLARPPR